MQFADAIKAVKERVSLVDVARRYVNLRPLGNRFVGPCPFHQETRPSFSISPDKGVFYCFGCQASGDLLEFYGRVNGLDFRESLLALAREAGIEIDPGRSAKSGKRADGGRERSLRQTMQAMHEDAARHFAANLARSEECRAYMDKRGLSGEIIEQFGLGWAERDWHGMERFLAARGYDLEIAREAGLLAKTQRGNYYDRFRGRLIFPIKNLSGQTIAFGGRIIANEEEAKYINSAETPIYKKGDHLFGLAQARRAISASGHAFLTEGYMDVLALRQFGFENGVAALGTALTEEQIQRLCGFTSKIYLLFDGDAPGRKAALRACELLLARGLSCFVINLPDGEDIDSFLRAHGAEAFGRLRDAAMPGIEWSARSLRSLAPREAIAWARNFLGNLRVPELLSPYASTLARQLGISESAFRQSLAPAASAGRMRQAALPRNLCERDTQIIMYAARYPERLDDLRSIGADLALTSPRSKLFWQMIEEFGPEEVVYHLDDKQKAFWLSQRGPEAPPRDNGEFEFSCLKRALSRYYARAQAEALDTARGSGSFDLDLQYLHAIRDAMRNTDEQS